MLELEKVFQEWRSLQPISERDSYRLSRKFTVEFNYNSNHIEGNTLTYGQTEFLLLFGKVVGEAEMRDLEEMKASGIGQKMMEEEALARHQPLTQNFIRQLHRTLLREDYTVYRQLDYGEQTSFVIHVGQYKTRPNSVITRYGDRFDYASPEETPALMTDLVDWYNASEQSGDYTPVQLAALFHYRYIRIHPFENGNGRMARLLANYILLRHDYPMIVIRNRNKQAYMDALHQSDVVVGPVASDGAHASLHEARLFVRFFTQTVAAEIQNDIDFIREKSARVWWFDGKKVKFRSPNAYKILTALQDNPSISISQLKDEVGIQPSTLRKQLRQMEQKGYITKWRETGEWHVLLIPTL